MKKLVLLASIAIAMIIYQPAKAQVSLSINIGTPGYYAPAYESYYVPRRTVVYTRPVVYNRPVVVYHPKKYVSHGYYAPTRVHYTNYSRPVYRSYSVKHVKFQGNKHHGRGHRR